MDKYLNSKIKIFYKYFKGDPNQPTLIFLHGVGGNWTQWKKEIEYFKKKKYTIVAPDLRGHGLSSKPEKKSAYSFNYFINDLNRLIKTEKLKNISLIGHSLGGTIAMYYLTKKKNHNVKNLILLDSPFRFPFKHNDIACMGPFLTHALRTISENKLINRLHFPHLPNLKDFDMSNCSTNHVKLYLKSFLNSPLRSLFACFDELEEFDKLHKNVEKDLKKLKIPTLIIDGSNDKVFKIKDAKKLKDFIKKSKLKIVKGADHFITIEKPNKIDHLILKFIKKHE